MSADRRQGRRKAPPKTGKGPGRRQTRRRSWGRRVLGLGGATLAWLAVALVGFLAYTAWQLPSLEGLGRLADRRPAVSVVDAEGTLLARYGDLYGEPVSRRDLPEALVLAVLATEDRRFYAHDGIDLVGILRATVANLRAGGIVQGGSTLTQQLAKIAFLSPERTFSRKLQEAMLAVWLELHFGKDEILTLYLNRVYLGAGAYGVSAAAQRYFDKPVPALTLAEAAMLAGLLKAPSRLAPTRDYEAAAARAAVVLDGMVAAGLLDAPRAEAAKRAPARLRPGAGTESVRYFTDWVLSQLPDHVGRAQRDLTVVTTLDLRLQQAAEAALRVALAAEGEAAEVGQGAVLVLTPDGAVRAMIGGRDYQASQFNRAVQAVRQPGSAFKPVVYLTALERGLTPDARFEDAPIRIGKWSPVNFDGKYRGPVTLAEALAQSINTVAVRVGAQVGEANIVATARRLGITTPQPLQPAVALGAGEVTMLELTTAYATLAAGGRAAIAHGIAEVRDDRGQVVYRRQGGGAGQAARPEAVARLTGMLRWAIEGGTGRAARLDRPAAGKTGTSQDHRDAWFLGYTADFAAAVWVGNDSNRPMRKVTGSGLPARIWREVMTAAHRDRPARPLVAAAPPPARAAEPRPAGVDRPQADRSLIDRITSIFSAAGSGSGEGTLADRPRPDGGP